MARLRATLPLLLALIAAYAYPQALHAGALAGGGPGHRDYFIVAGNNSDIILYLLEDSSVKMIPLDYIIDGKCDIDPDRAVGAGIVTFTYGRHVNLTLPDGTEVDTVNVIARVYVGCSSGGQELYDVRVEEPVPGVLYVTLYVLAPPPPGSNYMMPARLVAEKAAFTYTTVNETHFTVNITLYNVEVNQITFYNNERFNVTVSFLVDKRSWSAKYWNGHAWVDAGVLPIAAPDLNVTQLLYKFYASYLEAINYYIAHPEELMLIVDKLKALWEENKSEEAIRLINRVVRAPLPAEWGARALPYLSTNYTLHLVDGAASSRVAVNYTVPAYAWVNVYPSREVFEAREALVDAVIDYIMTNDTGSLEDLVKRVDFIRYSHAGSSGIASFLYVFKNGVLPATGNSLMLLLPVDGLVGLPPELAEGVSAVILDVTNSIGRVVSDPSDVGVRLGTSGILAWEGCRGCVLTVVDGSLADEWMLTLNSTVVIHRPNILYGMYSAVVTKYINILYDIIDGGDPVAKLEELREYLESAVLTAAY